MRTESPQPDLQKSSSSSSSVVTPSPRADYGVFFSGGEKEGGTATQKHGNKPDNQAFRLNKQTQDGFVGFILPFLSSGKKLSRKDIEVIGNEAKRIGLPLDILKRLFEEHGEYCKQEKQEVTNLQKYRSKEFEDIEDVDESENILAYFSRMATLKEGGHLPKFNTEALESFVETNSSIVSEDVEVDLDVGYVKKSLDLSYDDAYNIHGSDSWDEAYPHEVNSDVSTTIQGRNRYEPGEPDPEASMFGHLLEEDVSPRRVTFALDSDGENEEHRPMKRSERKAPSSNIQEEEKKDEEERKESKPPSRPSHSHRGDRRDWTVCRRRRSIWHYGYEKDLDEWKLKRDMASWQFKPNNNADSVFSRATSCHSGGNSTCNEDNCAGPLTRPPPHISGQDAVRDLFAKKQERLDRRRERNQRLHLPDELEEAPKPWQLAYKERCKACPGYIGVEQYSLLDSTGVPVTPDPHDLVPWENRDVRQHFLHEQSISFSRNWFGKYSSTCVTH